MEAIQILCSLGANGNAANRLSGATPLHMAANVRKAMSLQRRLETIELLLEQGGCDPSIADSGGLLPVDIARQSSDGTCPQEVLDKLEPCAPGIFSAIDECDVKQVQEEVMSSSTVNSRFRDQRPLYYAVQELLERVEDDEDEENNEKEMDDMKHEEATQLKDIIQILLEAMEPQLEPSETGQIENLLSQLHETMRTGDATSSWHVSILKQVLLLYKAVGATSGIPPDTWQMLQRGARRGSVSFLKFLIDDFQLDPNSRGQQGMTALIFAARSGRIPVLVCWVVFCGHSSVTCSHIVSSTGIPLVLAID